jgi:hypothetical protein
MRHAVRSVIVLTASGLIVAGSMMLALELLKRRTGSASLHLAGIVSYTLMDLAGGLLIWKSDAIARALTDDLDE